MVQSSRHIHASRADILWQFSKLETDLRTPFREDRELLSHALPPN
jgi:hypothetical protein